MKLLLLILLFACSTEPEGNLSSSCNGCNFTFTHLDDDNNEVECDSTIIDFSTCNEGDLQFLQDLISSNSLTEESSQIDYNDGNNVLEPFEVGQQIWENGRLKEFNVFGELFGGDDDYFYYNISEIPESISNLNYITHLDFDHNNISILPESFSQLQTLEVLWLGDENPIEEIPNQIWSLVNLRKLGVYKTDITSIPNGIENLQNLTHLYFHINHLSSIPESIYNLSNIENFSFGDNNIVGEISNEVCTYPFITSLELQGNQLTGTIPDCIGGLSSLTNLKINNNLLSGSIPSEIGNLVNLTTLYLRNNQLSGEIPQEVCDLIESNFIDFNTILWGNNLINTCE